MPVEYEVWLCNFLTLCVSLCSLQVEEIVEDTFVPENIHLPSIYVQRVVKGERYDKVIEVHVCIYRVISSTLSIDDLCREGQLVLEAKNQPELFPALIVRNSEIG